MKNKVTVTIAGQEYTMVAVEDESYVRRCAQLVDEQLKQLLNGPLSLADASVLAAMNIADQYLLEQTAGEHLRAQLKQALEESRRLENELSEAKREIFKLSNRR